jgi:hypothetical protein
MASTKVLSIHLGNQSSLCGQIILFNTLNSIKLKFFITNFL